MLDPDAPAKNRGRPRKYPKGQEPYNRAWKKQQRETARVAAQEKAKERAAIKAAKKESSKRTASAANLDMPDAEDLDCIAHESSERSVARPIAPTRLSRRTRARQQGITSKDSTTPALDMRMESRGDESGQALNALASNRTDGEASPQQVETSSAPTSTALAPDSETSVPTGPLEPLQPAKRKRGRPRKNVVTVTKPTLLREPQIVDKTANGPQDSQSRQDQPANLGSPRETSKGSTSQAQTGDDTAASTTNGGDAAVQAPPETIEPPAGDQGRGVREAEGNNDTPPLSATIGAATGEGDGDRQDAEQSLEQDTGIASRESQKPFPATTLIEKADVPRSGGTLMYKRRKIVIDLVDKLGGVFPGDKELWYPYSMIWMKANPGAGKPDLKTLRSVQRSLVESGQMKVIHYTFTNPSGQRYAKCILARSWVEPDSDVVHEMQRRVKACDGENFIPPEAGVSHEMKKKLDQANNGFYSYMPKQVLVENTSETVNLHGSAGKQFLGPSLREKGGMRRSRLRGDWKQNAALQSGKTSSGKSLQLNAAEQRDAAAKIRMTSESPLWARTRVNVGSNGSSRGRPRHLRSIVNPAALLGPIPEGHGQASGASTDGSQRLSSLRASISQSALWEHDISELDVQPYEQVFDDFRAVDSRGMDLPVHVGRGTSDTFIAAGDSISDAHHIAFDPFVTFYQDPSNDRRTNTASTSTALQSQIDPILQSARGTRASERAAAEGSKARYDEQEAYERHLPRTLGDIVSRGRKGRVPDHQRSNDPVWSKFEYEVDRVRAWENRDSAFYANGCPPLGLRPGLKHTDGEKTSQGLAPSILQDTASGDTTRSEPGGSLYRWTQCGRSC